MKLKPFLPIIISGVIFIIFLFLPASWFTGLVTNKTLADNRISLTDQVLKGTLIQNKLFESNKYYPIYGSSELEKDCLLYTSPSPRDQRGSRMPSSA